MSHKSGISGSTRSRDLLHGNPRRGVAAALVAALVGSLMGLLPPSAAAGATQARTWVVDAVDTTTDNQWVSVDTATSVVAVEVGDTVEWQFDRATMGHDLTSLDSADDWDPAVGAYRDPNGAPIRYTFTKPGTYEYWCSIHGSTMRGTVVVTEPTDPNRPPTAAPTVDPREGDAPLYTHFEANAVDPDGDPLTYLWDFGTSSAPSDTSTSSHAHFNYTTPGRYTASLTVSDGRGGEFRHEYPVTVRGGQAPLVTASANPTTGTAPLNVTFVGRGEDQQDTDLTYAWDFGVPGTDTDIANGARAGYTYTTSGTFTATLTVTDPQGNAGTDTVEIVVGDAPPVVTLPEITATATPSTGTAPLDVALSTEVATGGTFEAFADGTATYPGLTGEARMVRRRGETFTTVNITGLKPDAAHMVHVHEESCASHNGGPHFRFDETLPFSEANEIWLPFTSDALGASGPVEDSMPIRAGVKAVAIVIHDPDNPARRIGCVDLEPSTLDLAYDWDFGDGSSGSGPDPDHTYTEPGTYTAEVTVTSPHAGHRASAARRHDSVSSQVEVVVERPDTAAPDTRVVAGPASLTRKRTAVFRFSSSEAGSTFECRVDSAATYRPCAAATTLRDLRDGSHRVAVRAVDLAGNKDATSAVRTWRVDTRGPSVRPRSPQGSIRDRTPHLRAIVRDDQGGLTRGNVRLQLDGVRRTIRYDARTGRVSRDSGRALAVGRHTVRIVATDRAGNRTVVSWSFRIRR